jgi:hypothetical protein
MRRRVAVTCLTNDTGRHCVCRGVPGAYERRAAGVPLDVERAGTRRLARAICTALSRIPPWPPARPHDRRRCRRILGTGARPGGAPSHRAGHGGRRVDWSWRVRHRRGNGGARRHRPRRRARVHEGVERRTGHGPSGFPQTGRPAPVARRRGRGAAWPTGEQAWISTTTFHQGLTAAADR